MKIRDYLILGLLASLLLLSSCSDASSRRKLTIVYTPDQISTSLTLFVEELIQKQTDLDIELILVTSVLAWEAIARGGADLTVSAWLPDTHGEYFARLKNNVERVGDLVINCKIGLVVPDFVSIRSIDELNAHAKQFQKRILGVEPAAGSMLKTEKAMDAYGLDQFHLLPSTESVVMSELAQAIKNKTWLVAVAWTPHQLYGHPTVRFLDDPLKSYGANETIVAIARKGFTKDFPEVVKILQSIQMDAKDLKLNDE